MASRAGMVLLCLCMSPAVLYSQPPPSMSPSLSLDSTATPTRSSPDVSESSVSGSLTSSPSPTKTSTITLSTSNTSLPDSVPSTAAGQSSMTESVSLSVTTGSFITTTPTSFIPPLTSHNVASSQLISSAGHSSSISVQTHTTSSQPTSPSTSTSAPTSIPITTSTTVATTEALSPSEPWMWVGVAAAVLVVLLVVTVVLCVCVLHRLCTGKRSPGVQRKLSKNVSSKKLIECTLEEIKDNKNSSLEHLFDHLAEVKLTAIPASSLPSYVSRLHEEDGYPAEEEYDDVRDLDPPAPCKHASLSFNESRNRYTNIWARDSTRVVLSTISKVAGSDYINANFIDGFTRPREYIAAQGPLPSTCPDFWRMVWEHNVNIIVMVTNLEESGMIKCHQYWPNKATAQYGNLAVTLESEVLYPEFVVRELGLATASKSHKKNSQVGVKRTVMQYHFTVWPDFGVPKEASAMIKFVRQVRRAIEPSHGPVVVHCSAGVGRSGTFIAVDVLIQKMDAGGLVNVQELVCRMRAQRSFMVQTPAQYLFIYDSLLHYHLFGKMEVDADDLGAYIAAMDKPSEDGSTPLDKEFEHVIGLRLSQDSLFSIALDEENNNKNRDNNNIPLDNNRVVLKDPSSDQDYINASFITGYYNRIEFIVTQHPLQSTMGDFWAMVWERNVKTIVTIGPLIDQQECYWPTASSEPRSFDSGVRVSLVEREWVEEAGAAVREMTLNSVEDTKETKTVMQFHLQSWPVDGAPSQTRPTIDLIKRSREHWRESGYNLILVHTAAGVSSEATGVYCGLCVLSRQLDVEDGVDVFTTVRKLRRQRPAILTSKDYYRFMYQVIESLQQDQY